MKWLQWLIDNPWAAVVIITVLGQLWKAATKQKGGADEAPPQAEESTFDDPELAERTRKIREEIQRKIAERAKGYPTEQPRPPQAGPEAPPPIIREVVVTPAPILNSGSRQEAQRNAEILEEQAALAEKLRELAHRKAAAQKRTEFEAATADQSAAKRTRTRDAVLDDLCAPEALRRAFILREVLGPPVALRR